MKKTKILYWVFTLLFSAFMMFSAIPDAMVTEQAVQVIHTDLGYPKYIIAFIGIVKILGVIAILIPGYPRVKEWAYAGLMFDLILATYSILVSGYDKTGAGFMAIPIIFGILSYIYYHKKRRLETGTTAF